MPESLYTLDRDGQRYGPYTLDELKDYRAQGNVHDRDLVWTEGLPQWVTAGSVLARQTLAVAPPVVAPPRAEPPIGPAGGMFATPAAAEPDTRGFFARLFSMEGRMNRGKYFGTLVALFGLLCLVVLLLIIGGAALGIPIGPSPNGESGPFEFVVGLAFQVPAAFQVVKRLHDIDRPGTHYWLLLIPLYNIYLGCLLLFQKGTDGDNQFGPDPLAARAT